MPERADFHRMSPTNADLVARVLDGRGPCARTGGLYSPLVPEGYVLLRHETLDELLTMARGRL